MSQLSVAILGGGLAGLTLGRVLRKKGISYVIYDRSTSAPRHTYAITLESWAYKPLLNALELDEQTFKQQLAVDSLYHDGTGVLSAVDTKHSNTSAKSFRACRNKFESMLKGDQEIKYEYILKSARLVDNENAVELDFQNGTNVKPTIMVDTLGVHSPLRRSLLPDLSPKILPFAVFSGKRYVKTEDFETIYAPAFGQGNVLVLEPSRPNDPRLEITVNEHKTDGKISISYVYSRAAHADARDPVYNPQRSMAGAIDIPEEFYQELETFLATRSPKQPFPQCFDTGKIRTERLLNWLMRTMMVPESELRTLLKSGVVMIGDSVHATPILGGRGANLAIADAIELAEVIGNTGDEKAPLTAFYERKWQKWSDEVEESEKEISDMHSVAKSSL